MLILINLLSTRKQKLSDMSSPIYVVRLIVFMTGETDNYHSVWSMQVAVPRAHVKAGSCQSMDLPRKKYAILRKNI